MREKLVSAIRWDNNQGTWSCSLICHDEKFERIPVEPGSHLKFKVLKGRFCIGSTQFSAEKVDDTASARRELKPCPQRVELKRGIKCTNCSLSDLTSACARCNGHSCNAHSTLRKDCEDSTAYVYLASFGLDRVKAGVSKERRFMKRWIEQGADIAKRVLVGDAREARRFEKKIQDELGALRRARARHKMKLTRSDSEIERALKLINKFETKIHEIFPEKHQVHEEPHTLLPYYRLPKTDKRPLNLNVKDGLVVTGNVLGVKGPILLIKTLDLPFTIDLNKLVGRKIITGKVSSISIQTGMDRFIVETS